MTDKEFKKLSRSQLIEIIYQLQKNEEETKKEIDALKAELESKRLKIEKAGSIAEAVVGLNDIFLNAQNAADQYLEEIHIANADVEKRAEKIISSANQKAAQILAHAKQESNALRANAEKEAEEKWNAVNAKVNQLLRARTELSSLLENK